ncbi:MAG TPA: hypothetical protein VFM74_01520 [Candidatus Limnocylindria bacterium]|nr:hypothetical protein [Candidatus Limnocylindria bacterium]
MVDDLLRVPARRPASPRTIPALVWLPLIAAAIQVAVLWLSRSAVMQPLPLDSIVGIVSNVTPFLLAAAVLLGLPRWQDARRWLLGAVGAFALVGVLDLGRDVWFAAQPYGNLPVDDTSQALMRIRGTIVGALSIAAPVLLGIGLWTGRPERTGRVRRVAVLSVGVVGGAAIVGGMLEAWLALGLAPERSTPLDVPLLVLTGLNPAGLAVLGVAAARNVSGGRSLPELLIAVGATLWLAANGWVQWSSFALLSAGPLGAMPDGWYTMIDLTSAIMLLGMLVVIVGFGSGGWLRRPRSD